MISSMKKSAALNCSYNLIIFLGFSYYPLGFLKKKPLNPMYRPKHEIIIIYKLHKQYKLDYTKIPFLITIFENNKSGSSQLLFENMY